MIDSTDQNMPWLPDAKKALEAAIREDVAACGDILNAAFDTYGPEVLTGFAQAWIDTFQARAGIPTGAIVHTRHICADDGKETRTPPADVDWVSQLIAARIRRDRNAFGDLLEQITDGADLAAKLSHLVMVVALSINDSRNQTPRNRTPHPHRGVAFGLHPPVAHAHGPDDVRPPV